MLKELIRYVLLIVATFLLTGCIGGNGQEEVMLLDIEPVVDNQALGGFTGEANEGIYIVEGEIDTAWEKARELITGKSEQVTEFNSDGPLNFVVFRGVFSSGGYGLKIISVKKEGNIYLVHAEYSNPGEGMMVTGEFTHPTAIIPVGKIPQGDYKVKLIVTSVERNTEGDITLEDAQEHSSIGFTVR